MLRRKRYPRPSAAEIAIGQRLHQVRTEYGISRRLLAEHLSISTDQLNRIERGMVALRFGFAWRFCELTKTNPLWLAFGDDYPRGGFAPMVAIRADENELFSSVMSLLAGTYQKHRLRYLKITPSQQRAFGEHRAKIKMLATTGAKRYLAAGIETPVTWTELRHQLLEATSEPGTKAALARELKISTAAVSQWLSGASAPSADNVLQILTWIRRQPTKKKTAIAFTRDRRAKSKKGKVTK